MTATTDEPLLGQQPTRLDSWLARVRASALLTHRIDVLAPTLITLLAAVLRLWNLGHPHELVFDETYYVKDAYSQWMLGYPAEWPDGADADFAAGRTDTFTTTGSFVVHPPLGKWLIGLGMFLFGADSSTGWRIATAVLGSGTVLLVWLLAKRLTGSTAFASVAGLLVAVDGVSIVLSRVALLDGILTFFIVLTFLLALIDRQRVRVEWSRRAASSRDGWGPVLWNRPWLLAAGAAAGAATAVKWSGLYALAAIGLYAVVSDALQRRREGMPHWTWGALAQGVASFLLLIPVAFVVYLASWAGWFATDGGYDRHAADAQPATGGFAWVPLSLQSLWIYHKAIYAFHVGLTTPHGYASPAWQWPLLIRPTSMYWHRDDPGVAGCTWSSGCAQSISSIPNPVIWWAAVAATVWLVFWFVTRRRSAHAFVLVGVACTYLPWLAFPERTIFQFYTVAMVPFLAIALTFALREIAGWRHHDPRRRMIGQRTVWIFLGVCVALSALWYPVWTGMPVPYTFWLVHNWLPTWI